MQPIRSAHFVTEDNAMKCATGLKAPIITRLQLLRLDRGMTLREAIASTEGYGYKRVDELREIYRQERATTNTNLHNHMCNVIEQKEVT